MLLCGPPTMEMTGVPCTFKALTAGFTFGFCGSRTRIGIGAEEYVRTHAALATTSTVVLPLTRPVKVVGIRSQTLTARYGLASPAGMQGGVTFAPHTGSPEP